MEKSHALVIGIADYQNIRKLPQVHDAQDIAALLTDPHFCGYPSENVELLMDEGATQAALRRGLARLAERSETASTVCIYFSGHGGHVATGPHAGEYLLPVDTVLLTEESLAQTSISSAELTTALRAIQARKLVVIFDCCHSGGVGQPKSIGQAPSLQPGLSEGCYDTLRAGRGRVILAASRSSEYSVVMDGARYGLFTEHLLDGLRGGVASEDGMVRIFDLFEYLQPKVTKVNPAQHPIFKAELEDNFAIALYRGGQKGSVAKDDEGFRYDAYISYVDRDPDATWVWKTLVPRLEKAGLRLAISGDVEDPGVARVVSIERGMQQAKRTVIVLSDAYLNDNMAAFENALGQSIGLHEGTARLLPLTIGPVDPASLPHRLRMLSTLKLEDPSRLERGFDRLVKALQGPLPRQ